MLVRAIGLWWFVRSVVVLAALVLLLGDGAAVAQTGEENWSRCGALKNADRVIHACTALIQSGQETTETLSLAFDYRGAAFDHKGEYDRAIRDYDQAIRLDPSYADVFYNRALVYGHKLLYERAIADYDQAIRLNLKDAPAFNNRGNAYYHLQQYDRAIEDYEQAIRIDPTYADAFNNRGLAYFHEQQHDRAIEDYDQAIRLNPNDAEAFNNRGCAYGDKMLLDHATQDFDHAIQLDPEYASALSNRCWARAIEGQLQQALEDCNFSLRIRRAAHALAELMHARTDCSDLGRPCPADADTLDSRAFTYLKMGKFALAIEDYVQALAADPSLASSLYGRGLAKRAIADPAADVDIAAAKQLDPEIATEFQSYGIKGE